MSSIQRIQREIEEDKQFRDTLMKPWIPEVVASRLVIRPDDTSYFDKVGVYSSTLFRRRFHEGTSDAVLRQDYPGLTSEDLRACYKFEMLRTVELL